MTAAKQQRKILVTNALPYANGALHLGHMVGFMAADFWVRYQKLRGHKVQFVGGDDQHGTPIMLSAEEQGINPQQLIDRIEQQHLESLREFAIDVDNYTGSHAVENEQLSSQIYRRLQDAGHIQTRTIKQAYDEQKGMFLPDRYVIGTCPKCKSADQYGDNCEVCGSTYDTTDLIEPRSVLSGEPPIERESEHYFFTVSAFESLLNEWKQSDALQPEIANKLQEWFEGGLQDWDISRDKPYWGFEIPNAPGKYFYVWLDAPIGYMASHKVLCDKTGEAWDSTWSPDSDVELYHFIGKDIVRFHTLFWPAMLHASGHRIPTGVFVHGFLMVDGAKMSKSRGTFIEASTYLKHLKAEYLRYYFAAKLSAGVVDIDLNLEDFVSRVNSDLVGKVVNIASRCAGFIAKQFDGELAEDCIDPELQEEILQASNSIADRYEKREYAHAMREIMSLADRANQYIDEHKPWVMIKEQDRHAEVQHVCTAGLNAFRALCIMLKPVLPALVADAEAFLNSGELRWDDLSAPLSGSTINKFKPLLTRIETTSIEKMIEDSKESLNSASDNMAEQQEFEAIAEQISIDDFAKIDLRVARIVKAEHVDGADKLLKLSLDLGIESRTVFAGIKSAYEPEQLQGQLTVVVANLAPRKMRFGVSEGMVLAAGPGGDELYVLNPDSGAKPGMRIT